MKITHSWLGGLKRGRSRDQFNCSVTVPKLGSHHPDGVSGKESKNVYLGNWFCGQGSEHKSEEQV